MVDEQINSRHDFKNLAWKILTTQPLHELWGTQNRCLFEGLDMAHANLLGMAG